MAPRKTNAVLLIVDDVCVVDISTKAFPHQVTKIALADLPLMLDGMGRWQATETQDGKLYVGRRRSVTGKKQWLHRLILGLTDRDTLGDHENHDTLDNRRDNLREATRQNNCRNSSSAKNSTSKYLGVCWYKAGQRWRASITIDRKHIHLGYFDNEEDAARAYDVAAFKHFGVFANLNFFGVSRLVRESAEPVGINRASNAWWAA